MLAVVYNLLPLVFFISLFFLVASLLVWAIWKRYMPRVVYGSLILFALVIYFWWLANFLSTVLCFAPGPGCGARVSMPMASAVGSAYILLAYSLLAGIVALVRWFIGKSVKKLVICILVVVAISSTILVADSIVPFEYSSARSFDNDEELNIPTIPGT